MAVVVAKDGFRPGQETVPITDGTSTFQVPFHGETVKDYEQLKEKMIKVANDLAQDPLT
jgi:hypothetical protein